MLVLREFSIRIARLVVVLAVAALVPTLLTGAARSAGRAAELIAFMRSDGIYLMNTDGSDVRAVKRGIAPTGMHWSPDGRKLAFTVLQTGLWTMSADGSGLRRLVADGTSSLKAFGEPTWTPRGRIAFTANRGGERSRDIWLVDADGSHLRRLAKTPRLWEYFLDWSPAGNRIAFTHATGMDFRLYVADPNGTHRRVVNPNWKRLEAVMPDWSPDGRRLAFVGFRQRQDSSVLDVGIWEASASGTLQIRLTKSHAIDTDPSWSHDGRRVAFLRSPPAKFIAVPERASEIYVMNADGTGVTRLTDNKLGEGNPAWQPRTPQ